MTELERLKDRLFNNPNLTLRNFSIFRGDDPKATPEDVAREINRALDQIERGDFEDVTDIDD